jgi:arginase
MPTAQPIHIIGFPMNLGAARRGMDMGPSALRIANVQQLLENLGFTVQDEGDLHIRSLETLPVGDPKLRYLSEIVKVSTMLSEKVRTTLEQGAFPLVLGGDHAMGIGSLAGIGAYCKAAGKTLGVVWVDAHADMNTAESSLSGNIHGMPLAVSMGVGVAALTGIGGEFQKVHPQNVTIVGARDLDVGEVALIKKLAVKTYTMYEVDKIGIHHIAEEIVARMKAQGVDHLHVSFDVDSCDPTVAPAVGTAVPGGLSYREAHFIMEAFAESGLVSSMEVAEVNPVLDERNRTAVFAAGIVASCLGKRIL